MHQKNRGGIYPAGITCKDLMVNVITGGFSKEEVGHQQVAVEEMPFDEFRSCEKEYETGTAYNKRQSEKDELLKTCYQVGFDDVRYTCLAHNHMLTVVRAFMTKALWDVPPDTERNIVYCDAAGRLDLAAVAASKNGEELHLSLIHI